MIYIINKDAVYRNGTQGSQHNVVHTVVAVEHVQIATCVERYVPRAWYCVAGGIAGRSARPPPPGRAAADSSTFFSSGPGQTTK